MRAMHIYVKPHSLNYSAQAEDGKTGMIEICIEDGTEISLMGEDGVQYILTTDSDSDKSTWLTKFKVTKSDNNTIVAEWDDESNKE